MHAEVSRISCHSGSIALLQQLNWRGLALPEVHNKDPAESMNSENMQNTGVCVCVCVFASSSLNMQTLLGLRCMWHCYFIAGGGMPFDGPHLELFESLDLFDARLLQSSKLMTAAKTR